MTTIVVMQKRPHMYAAAPQVQRYYHPSAGVATPPAASRAFMFKAQSKVVAQ